jgi:hypothetical protein
MGTSPGWVRLDQKCAHLRYFFHLQKICTRTGLNVKAEIDHASYPAGVKVTDDEMAAIKLTPHAFHGEWNYTIAPKTG